MSLINEALKKAQRQRTEDSLSDAPPMPGGGGGKIAKRGQARSANTMVLIGAGAVVLVVLSVVGTVFLVNRPSKPTVPPASAKPQAAPSAATVPPAAPAIVPPVITPPAVSTPPVAAVEPAAPPPSPAKSVTPSLAETKLPSAPPAILPQTQPASAVAPSRPIPSASPLIAASPRPESKPPPAALPPVTAANVAVAPAAPVPASTAAATPPAPTAAPKPDDRITAFVEAIRVTGIRASGDESRVLMNDRVYRVNDVVDRTLGVRLVKAAADSLTFVDPNGITYVKFF